MNETLFRILNPIPAKNRQVRIIINHILPTTIIILLLLYPYALMDKRIELNNISIYSEQGISVDGDEIKQRLENHKIRFQRRVDIFMPTSKSDYDFMTYYLARESLGINQLTLNRIFISPDQPSNRTISDIIIHELGHSYIKQEFGFIRSLKMPEWKQEGFCEYIAESSTMDTAEGIAIFKDRQREEALLASNSIEGKRYRYFRYRMVFRYLIEVKGMAPRQIFESEIDLATVLSGVKDHLSVRGWSFGQ